MALLLRISQRAWAPGPRTDPTLSHLCPQPPPHSLSPSSLLGKVLTHSSEPPPSPQSLQVPTLGVATPPPFPRGEDPRHIPRIPASSSQGIPAGPSPGFLASGRTPLRRSRSPRSDPLSLSGPGPSRAREAVFLG